MRRIPWITILLGLGALGLAAADDEQQGPPPQGPAQQGQMQQAADRSVARISLINGDITVRRGDSGDATAAAINAPLLVQDILQTGGGSRAEIQFDSSNMVRLGANSEVRMGDLQFQRYQVQVGIGTVSFRVLRQSEAQVEIATPSAGIRPLRVGIYRVTVREDGSSEITVRDGEAEVATAKGVERLRAGSTMMLRGDPQDPEFLVVGESAADEFDRWNSGRDRDLERSRSSQYVSRDIYGAEDLDGHGEWVNDPSYGYVWAPRVAPGWAPYREGRWVWEDYYGWTWVSYDPWGWAPYHYGRWFHGSLGWCWYPGSRYERHYWSPALVGFFGFGGRGGGVAVGFGFGNVGWVPLAPYERFNPWWGRGYSRSSFVSNTVVNNTTVINNTNITNVYRNAGVANGVSGVAASDFGRRGGQYSSVSAQNVRDAGLVRGALPVNPDRSSLRYADRTVNAAPVRGAQFYSRSTGTSSSAQRAPFSGQSQQRTPVANIGYQGGYQGGSQAGSQGASAPHAWRSFGEPVHGSSAAGSGAGPSSSYRSSGQQPSQVDGSRSGGGWSRFNGPSQSQAGGRQPSYSAPSQAYGVGSGRGGGWSSGNAAGDRSGRGMYNPPRSASSGDRGQAVRINPAIVHDRSASQAPPARSSSNGGGSGRSSGSSGHSGSRK